MLDIKLIRHDPERVKKSLRAKGVEVDLEKILQIDQKSRDLQKRLDALRHQKNMANQTITRLIKEKKDPQKTISAMKDVSAQIDVLEPQVRDYQQQCHDILITLPNLPHPSVPVGTEENNQVVRCWGKPITFDFKPKTHIEIAENLDVIDFKRAAKLTGSGFILFKNQGARLERALFNFMLDVHTTQHGYTEVFPPVLVNRDSMIGTGQLPKMEGDMYKLQEEDLFLIPTAEVPVTNMHRNEVLQQEDLPLFYAAYTPCFRREAGSYGKDTKGLIRVHQFDKVELVKFVKPQSSYDELESLVAHAEKIFQLLELPYRVVALASADLSFAAAKCYDIEVYAPGVQQWLEVSSCSHFEDFQARRANIRYKDKDSQKIDFVHTLNGSGVALARTVVAILENYQTQEGEVIVPEVLKPYMQGQHKLIRASG